MPPLFSLIPSTISRAFSRLMVVIMWVFADESFDSIPAQGVFLLNGSDSRKLDATHAENLESLVECSRQQMEDEGGV